MDYNWINGAEFVNWNGKIWLVNGAHARSPSTTFKKEKNYTLLVHVLMIYEYKETKVS